MNTAWLSYTQSIFIRYPFYVIFYIWNIFFQTAYHFCEASKTNAAGGKPAWQLYIEQKPYLLCLNCKGMITAIHEVAHGVLSECPMSSKSIFARALLSNAASVIIAHNHPSGDPSPSQADIDATKRIREAGALLEIPVADHLIIASDSSYYSFKENGLIQDSF